jgi:hypothetical protein
VRVECLNCGMPYDIPDEPPTETFLCDCGATVQTDTAEEASE